MLLEFLQYDHTSDIKALIVFILDWLVYFLPFFFYFTIVFCLAISFARIYRKYKKNV